MVVTLQTCTVVRDNEPFYWHVSEVTKMAVVTVSGENHALANGMWSSSFNASDDPTVVAAIARPLSQ